jgi:protein Mpv17
MSAIWARYNAVLTTNPILTKACTSFTGFLLGDSLAQSFVEPKDKPYDYLRTAKLAVFGLTLHGPCGHFFYKALDARFPGTAIKTVAIKVAIDQTLWNPIFACGYFAYLNLVSGKSLSDYKSKLEADLKTAVVGSWAVWIPAHTLNFSFVPPAQRLLYVNCVQVGYNVFLSFLGNKEIGEGKEEEVKEKEKEL